MSTATESRAGGKAADSATIETGHQIATDIVGILLHLTSKNPELDSANIVEGDASELPGLVNDWRRRVKEPTKAKLKRPDGKPYAKIQDYFTAPDEKRVYCGKPSAESIHGLAAQVAHRYASGETEVVTSTDLDGLLTRIRNDIKRVRGIVEGKRRRAAAKPVAWLAPAGMRPPEGIYPIMLICCEKTVIARATGGDGRNAGRWLQKLVEQRPGRFWFCEPADKTRNAIEVYLGDNLTDKERKNELRQIEAELKDKRQRQTTRLSTKAK